MLSQREGGRYKFVKSNFDTGEKEFVRPSLPTSNVPGPE
jgi:hypothetical protein